MFQSSAKVNLESWKFDLKFGFYVNFPPQNRPQKSKILNPGQKIWCSCVSFFLKCMVSKTKVWQLVWGSWLNSTNPEASTNTHTLVSSHTHFTMSGHDHKTEQVHEYDIKGCWTAQFSGCSYNFTAFSPCTENEIAVTSSVEYIILLGHNSASWSRLETISGQAVFCKPQQANHEHVDDY